MPSFTPPRDNQTLRESPNQPLDLVFLLRDEYHEIQCRFETVLEALYPNENAENIDIVESFLSKMSEELLQVEQAIFGSPVSGDEALSDN